ncbi:MAG TPA: amino acid permease [bacterium]|nr:amino acid permease [bacterium]HQN73113.1 amino acid permease [bacterium]HQO91099.1 amino acid permease [bacterium]
MSVKFGTFKGVFVPSTEAILGTVLFLLMPVLIADVGLWAMLGVIVLAHSVTLATSFSIADCATNLNNIGPGGMYALSRRSLGKALGGSIGFQLYLAQAASIGFYSIGFAEPLRNIVIPMLDFIPLFNQTDPASILLQKQLLGTFFFLIFFVIVMTGADFTLKIQTLILFVLGASIVAIIISPFFNITFEGDRVFGNGFNLTGNREITIALFFMTFAQFFPAVCGIDAGIGMSGDLRNPRKSLVKGTFWAIGVTFILYILSAIVFSMMKKDILIESYRGNAPVPVLLTDIISYKDMFPSNVLGVILVLGILFATGSSALSVFMTSPRTLQALAINDVLPDKFKFFAKDFRKNGTEPRYAIILSGILGLAIIWSGSINTASMIVGILFLVVYGWINGSAFLERASGNPGFRPTSRNHWSVSLYGFLISVVSIMLFDPMIGILIIISQYFMFRAILRYKAGNRIEGVWWGIIFSLATRWLKMLGNVVQGSKNWRPVMTALVISEKGSSPERTAYLGSFLAGHKGMVNLNIIGNEAEFNSYGIPYSFIPSDDINETAMALLMTSHPTGVEINTVLIEYVKKLHTAKVITEMISKKRNILLFQNSSKLAKIENIDIWWRGEMNGNLMVLLAYIITLDKREECCDPKIRIIRMAEKSESVTADRIEMEALLENARLRGEVVILENEKDDFFEVLKKYSSNADLIMMGLPGNFSKDNKVKIFNINEYFFDKQISKYDDLPSILFIKSAQHIELTEQ